jgi:hypothetical protein
VTASVRGYQVGYKHQSQTLESVEPCVVLCKKKEVEMREDAKSHESEA